MKAHEFVTEKKKKRRNKYGLAAWGPGPYGGYGYLAGYSGDSGAPSGGDGGGVGEGKVKLYTDPDYFGAEVDDSGFDSLPVVNIPADQLVGFEPDDKMNQSKSKANVKKIVAGLEKGEKLPPILVRKYK